MNNKNHYIQTEGRLFEAVQQSQLFTDCKTFVDSIPKVEPHIIEEAFNTQSVEGNFDLKKFIDHYFIINHPNTSNQVKPTQSMRHHIEQLWPLLTRAADNHTPFSTLLPLPYPYVVPGGRFQEIYYWDSYFTALGLIQNNHLDLVINMADNFKQLIEHVGHIPNGNRVYYLSRSQPPIYALLVDLIEQQRGIKFASRYFASLQQEYKFWMNGHEKLTNKNRAYRRAVLVADNIIMNRYWDDNNEPRPESYREDCAVYAAATAQQQKQLFRNIRASCESGWDFSSRWLHDKHNLATLYTTELIPVDLNCLLYFLEKKLAHYSHFLKKPQQQKAYQQRAQQRQQAIQQCCWNTASQFYFDHHWPQQQTSPCYTLAAAFPLFMQIAKQAQADAIAKTLQQQFLAAGGLITTLHHSTQQWDKPNGWAPLHWIAIKGLYHYGYRKLATDIGQRWLSLNTTIYQKHGKMLEKYNVCDPNCEAGGGEYPLQDGFGWTNGVALALENLLATKY